MRVPAPIRVRPVMTACGPTRQPLPSSTSSPTIAYGPISTSSAIVAPAPTIALGWTMDGSVPGALGIGPGRAKHFAAGDALVVDAGFGLVQPHAANHALLTYVEMQLVARHHGAIEAGLVDLDQVEKLLRAAGLLARQMRQTAGGLGHRLQDQHAGHDWMPREMALKEMFVDRHVLDRVNLGRVFHRPVQHPVDQQERVSVRQEAEDMFDVDASRILHSLLLQREFQSFFAAGRKSRSSWPSRTRILCHARSGRAGIPDP